MKNDKDLSSISWWKLMKNDSKWFLRWFMMNYRGFDTEKKSFCWLNHKFYQLFLKNIYKLSSATKNKYKTKIHENELLSLIGLPLE